MLVVISIISIISLSLFSANEIINDANTLKRDVSDDMNQTRECTPEYLGAGKKEVDWHSHSPPTQSHAYCAICTRRCMAVIDLIVQCALLMGILCPDIKKQVKYAQNHHNLSILKNV